MNIIILTNDNFFSFTVLEKFLKLRKNDIKLIVFSSALIGKRGTFASAIKKLAVDRELRKKMGQAGYEKAQREFDERRVCNIVLNTYKKLLDKKYDNN